MAVEVVRSEALREARAQEIRALLVGAFDGDFSDDDWEHTLGGWHVTASDGVIVAHAAVVERVLWVGERQLRTGYVEGVATHPSRHGEGLGSLVMRRLDEIIEAEFELGALSTSRHSFYGRLGWERWQGPSFVRSGQQLVRTADEDDALMVLRRSGTADLDLTLPITCEARSGDDW